MAKTSNKLELREKVRLANNLILKQIQTNVFDILTFHIFFLSDPSPIIGYACQWLPNWLTD